MLTATEIAGFAGVGLAGAAYVPQISHLVRARCSAGISRLAFEVWLLASVLTTARAIAIHADVFIALGGIQIAATTVITLCATRYKDTPCPSHIPRPPRAKTAAPGNEPRSGYLAGRSKAESATPAEHSGALRAYVPVLQPQSDPVTARPGQGAGYPGRAQLAEITDGRCGALRRQCQAGQVGPYTDFRVTYLKETT
jgi:hypothetical protein